MTSNKSKKKISVIKKGNFVKKSSSNSKVVFQEDYNKKKDYVEKKIQWNFSVNDLVYIKHSKKIGLIISDSIYINRRVQSNCYFTLVDSSVIEYQGKYLKKLDHVTSIK